jgi:hypothetical protein
MVIDELVRQILELDWRDAVPDELQSEVRMRFNEALAGGPNMNGDAGPTLTPNHALDCVWATQRIETQASLLLAMKEALEWVADIWLHHKAGEFSAEDAVGKMVDVSHQALAKGRSE